jgi:transcriptional regulator with XRE-family HTH domain
MAEATVARSPVGELLRAWRAKRRLSQLEVGLTAGVSSRHLSFIETGRAKASACRCSPRWPPSARRAT